MTATTKLYETKETLGHTHTILNPGTGFTDPAEDGHKHALTRGCTTCAKLRNRLGIQNLPTSFVKGHLHFFTTEVFK